MSSAAAVENRFVFGDYVCGGRGAMQWLSPVLFGLALPFTLAVAVFPAILEHAQVVAFVMLGALVVVSAVAYTLTVLLPGPVVAVVCDRANRQVQLVRSGLLAQTAQDLAFEDIAKVQRATRYDDDGYAIVAAELITTAGEVLALPTGASARDIEELRRVLGLAGARR